MIGNIKEIFPPKSGMREKQLLQDTGYVGVVREMHAACLQDIRCCCRGHWRASKLHSES